MIIITVAAILFAFALMLLIYKLLQTRNEFRSVRLLSLSTAADSDIVGGVGLSILVASPVSMSVVVNLLDSRYPLSEVIVALDGERQPNLLQHLKIRYSLVACSVEQCAVYRSRERAYRRLVVVVSQGEGRESLYDLAATAALFDYMMRVPPECRLFPFAAGRVAERLAAESSVEVDVVTTTERGVDIWSRRHWLACGGFGGELSQGYIPKILHIFEPLALCRESNMDYFLLIERSRYNFWDYFALKIMKTGNKLLSLVKPKNLL